jgi:hypothetical protein
MFIEHLELVDNMLIFMDFGCSLVEENRGKHG